MSPYENRPDRSFWKTGVSLSSQAIPEALYHPKFPISKKTRIATAGSCFAQHLGRNLTKFGYAVMDLEPAPPTLGRAVAPSFGYGLYSARYGNIYTVRQLLQLLRECIGRAIPADRVWERDGRYFDAQRPSVEPKGLSSPEMVLEHRAYHLGQVNKVFRTAELVVFTLGLTEVWEEIESGSVFPTAPGTIAGSFDPARYRFRNLTYPEIMSDFRIVLKILRRFNPDIRILLTVSPVPLTATATDDHVLVSNTYSKSVLRAVAGDLAASSDMIDYFPSYEIITGAPSRYQFFEPNLRSVAEHGVASVMDTFFASHQGGSDIEEPTPTSPKAERKARKQAQKAIVEVDDEGIVCEDALLEAFAR